MQWRTRLDKLFIERGVPTVELPASCTDDLRVVALGVSIHVGVGCGIPANAVDFELSLNKISNTSHTLTLVTPVTNRNKIHRYTKLNLGTIITLVYPGLPSWHELMCVLHLPR